MDKSIAQILDLPQDVENVLIGTLYDISVDDGGNNGIEIPDKWTLERFIEAGIIRNINVGQINTILYPYTLDGHVVFSDKLALNLDNIAASYQETKKRNYVIKINDTLSTIDCLYIKEKDAWYLIEFKNGDWNARDIEKKVHETLQLFRDLEKLDNSAVITTNRDKHLIEVNNLNLKTKLEKELGFEASGNFYKNNISLYIVYTDQIKKAGEFRKLCDKAEQYADMDKVFKQYKVFEKTEITPKVDLGYTLVSIFATYLLEATTNNKYYLAYCNIWNMYGRFKKIDGQRCKEYLDVLKTIPIIISKIPTFLSENGRGLFVANMSPDEFLRRLAVYSIKYCKEEEMPECELDEYDIVIGLLNTIMQKDYSEYIDECERVIQLFGDLLSDDKSRLKFICSDEFANEVVDLIGTNFYEVLGRILLIQRITDKKGCHCLTGHQQKQLLKNVLHINDAEADSVLGLVNNDMKLFLKFTALKVYFKRKYTCFWDIEKDAYMHMCRQIYYIKQLYDEKEIAGGSKQRTRTYGCFGTLLEDLMIEPSSIDFQKKVDKIEEKILKGNSRIEIQALQVAVQGLVSKKSIAIQQLKYKFEGSTFKKVDGCKSEDFDSIIKNNSCGTNLISKCQV